MKSEAKKQIIRTFVSSEEMAEYLADIDLSEEILADVIAGAPLPLETKAQYAWGEDKLLLEQALKELTLRPGEIFSLTDAWYDEQIKDVKRASSDSLFLHFEKAVNAIRSERAEVLPDGTDLDACCWYTLQKWTPDGLGNFLRSYSFTLFDDKPVFFTGRIGQRNKNRFSNSPVPDLNLPVPFAIGDILRVDCRPFLPPLPVLLLEKGDNRDCCCLQALYRDTDGEWRTAALKHGLHLQTLSGEPCLEGRRISPLYRLAKWTGKMPNDCAQLSKVQKLLSGEEAKGKRLWEALHSFAASEQ